MSVEDSQKVNKLKVLENPLKNIWVKGGKSQVGMGGGVFYKVHCGVFVNEWLVH